MAKKETGQEAIVCNLNGREIAAIGRVARERSRKLFGSDDFKSLDLGFEPPDKFLQLGGPQPTVSQLAVLASKLKLQLDITHLEFKTAEQIETENAADISK